MIAPASSFCTTIEMIVVLFLAGGSSCAAATVVVGVVRRDRRRGPVVGGVGSGDGWQAMRWQMAFVRNYYLRDIVTRVERALSVIHGSCARMMRRGARGRRQLSGEPHTRRVNPSHDHMAKPAEGKPRA